MLRQEDKADRCRQANERWTESNGNNLKYLINGIMADGGLTLIGLLSTFFQSVFNCPINVKTML